MNLGDPSMTDDRCGSGWWCIDAHLKRAILWYSGQVWFDSVAYCSSFNVVSIYACIVGTSYQCNEAFCRSDPFWCLHHVNPESDTPNNLHRSPRGTRVKNLGLLTGAGDDHVWNFGKNTRSNHATCPWSMQLHWGNRLAHMLAVVPPRCVVLLEDEWCGHTEIQNYSGMEAI